MFSLTLRRAVNDASAEALIKEQLADAKLKTPMNGKGRALPPGSVPKEVTEKLLYFKTLQQKPIRKGYPNRLWQKRNKQPHRAQSDSVKLEDELLDNIFYLPAP